MMTSPPRITSDVRRLCKKLGNVGEPVFVDVEARSDSQLNDCFIDVERQVAEHGGSAQHGWLVWEVPGVLIEGEFHAVWRKHDGSLLDVTFKKDGESRVLFVPDFTRRFDGKRVFTIRHAIGRDPRIKEFMNASARLQRLIEKQNRDRFGEEIRLDSEALALSVRVQLLGRQLLISREARKHAH